MVKGFTWMGYAMGQGVLVEAEEQNHWGIASFAQIVRSTANIESFLISIAPFHPEMRLFK